MQNGSYQLFDGKAIIRLRTKACATSDDLLTSSLFFEELTRYVKMLSRQQSRLLQIFGKEDVTEQDLRLLVETFKYLTRLPAHLVPRILDGAEIFFRDHDLLFDFVEQLYNYWRSQHRVIICDSIGDRLDKRPYRTFNDTVESLMHIVRSTYRDIQENITGAHPRVYRQLSAGAEIGAIAVRKNIPYSIHNYKKLNGISVIRQVLIYPPLIYSTPMNKRTGSFERVSYNPLDGIELNSKEWLCYPAKVGSLVIMVYFHLGYSELGFSLCNLFELAEDADLERQPDAIYLFGAPPEAFHSEAQSETIFYDDEENGVLVGAVPLKDRYAYFGYLKKMVLTLHNIKMMKLGRLPFHGAMVNITLRDHKPATVLIIGDTGAGKSETLEALRNLARDDVEDLVIIADDMGSIEIDQVGAIKGYGTEIGAFVRLDDLQSGYAWGQIDRTIIMNPDQTNARVVIPVTMFDEVVRGYPIDYILYANNYEPLKGNLPAIQAFQSSEEALAVFREGKVMSKGTTTTTGLVGTYFANIFGPLQYQELHNPLAEDYFQRFFEKGLFVGQMRTQLGIHGMEQDGPQEAARQLLEIIQTYSGPAEDVSPSGSERRSGAMSSV